MNIIGELVADAVMPIEVKLNNIYSSMVMPASCFLMFATACHKALR